MVANKRRAVLNRNFQFQSVYRNGKSFVSPLLVTYVARRRRGGIRYGITASKKIGGAVARNRARRVVKAAAGEVLSQAGGSFDIVFVCRQATISSKSYKVAAVLSKQLRKAGVLAPKESEIGAKGG